MRTARTISRGVFLFVFLWLFLQTRSRGDDVLGYPVRIFLDADPLIALTTLVASHTLAVASLLSLVVIVLTLLLGRVFCGWICPLGTLHDAAGALGSAGGAAPPAPARRRWKYAVLVFLVAASLFSVQLAGLLDPISLLIRSLTLAVYPMLSIAAEAAYDAFHAWHPPVLFPAGEALYDFAHQVVLPSPTPRFRQGFAVGAVFFGILALNLIQRRFWCKNLCPLGALLGLMSRYALVTRQVSEGCTACGACAAGCPAEAIADGGRADEAECIRCLECRTQCPERAVRFHPALRGPRRMPELGRRRLLVSAAAGIVTVPLLRVSPPAGGGASPTLIRPPGSLAEEAFLSACVRCGECMKVCITNGLQPALGEAGLEGLWTPVLVPQIGYCEYRCTLCGQVCPTGAIRRLTPGEKETVKIGLAMIDPGRCLPYAQGIPCQVCEEVCPTPRKAIWLDDVRVRRRDGDTVTVKQPRIDLDLCVGCGICETRCPVRGRPAITVISAGESRSPDSRVLL